MRFQEAPQSGAFGLLRIHRRYRMALAPVKAHGYRQ
jgi:hypothetical protein